MKNVITILALTISVINAHAQLVQKSGSYTYDHVERVSGQKIDLYHKAEQWVNENHEGSKNTVQQSSEERGQLVIKGMLDHESKTGRSNVAYICTIQFRNGMYKESFGDFKYVRLNGVETEFESKKLKGKSKIIEDTEIMIAALSSSLKEHITTHITASEN
jgi:hypothetical protein